MGLGMVPDSRLLTSTVPIALRGLSGLVFKETAKVIVVLKAQVVGFWVIDIVKSVFHNELPTMAKYIKCMPFPDKPNDFIILSKWENGWSFWESV
jgi:hypothetical protein